MKNGQFWEWFEAEAAPHLGFRGDPFRRMFEYLDNLDKPVIIVETGCVRRAGNWAGDGQSTVLFDRYVRTKPGSTVHTVDIDPQATAVCTGLVGEAVTVHTGDSVAVLRILARRLAKTGAVVDLLYLDSFDVDPANPVPSAVHHLKELVSIAPVATEQTLVVVDDSPFTAQVIAVDDTYKLLDAPTIGGKGKYVAEYAEQVGATNLFSCYQVGWIGVFP